VIARHLRLEPRRLHPRHRSHLGRPGRSRRPAPWRRRDLGRPHRPATDLLTLNRLRDDYGHDGRVITEILDAKAIPQSLRAHRAILKRLGAACKQINAPLGQFGLDVIKINDAAVRATDQARYAQLAAALQQLGDERNTIAAGMRTLLEQAAFGNTAINEQQARRLTHRRRRCSRAPTPWPRHPRVSPSRRWGAPVPPPHRRPHAGEPSAGGSGLGWDGRQSRTRSSAALPPTPYEPGAVDLPGA
jgi:hypothetical protein